MQLLSQFHPPRYVIIQRNVTFVRLLDDAIHRCFGRDWTSQNQASPMKCPCDSRHGDWMTVGLRGVKPASAVTHSWNWQSSPHIFSLGVGPREETHLQIDFDCVSSQPCFKVITSHSYINSHIHIITHNFKDHGYVNRHKELHLQSYDA